MKKILLGIVVLAIGLPFSFSLLARYYLNHHLLDNLQTDYEIERLDFKHGWLQSHAQLDFRLTDHKLNVRTENLIYHGPIIWSKLLSQPSKAFSLYLIDTQFDLSQSTALQDREPLKGNGHTRVSYSTRVTPHLEHPGIDLSLFNSQVFSDLPTIYSEFRNDGTIMTKITGNQFELNDNYQNIYLTGAQLELLFNTTFSMPKQIKANVTTLSTLVGADKVNANQIVLDSVIELNDNNSYSWHGKLDAASLQLNQANSQKNEFEFQVSQLDPQLIEYLSDHYFEVSTAIQNNHWLVLLKHFSEVLKHIKINQPQFNLNFNGEYSNQPVELDFQGQLLADKTTQLNPFSLLENIELTLNTTLPIEFVKQMNRPELLEFLHLMTDKGLLVIDDNTYHSNLSFNDAKLKIAHAID